MKIKIEIKYNWQIKKKLLTSITLTSNLMSSLSSTIKEAGGCINTEKSGSMSLKFTFPNDSMKRVFSLVMKSSGEYEVKAFTDYTNYMEPKKGQIDIVVSTLSELLEELKAVKL